MNILITAPDLDPTKNVSGIATVVDIIMKNNNRHRYFHYLLGRADAPAHKISWLVQLIQQLLRFPFFLKKRQIDLVHQNLPFDPKGLLRESIINYWCRLMKVPVVLHVHGGIFLMNKTTNPIFFRLSRSLFNHSRQVVVLSEIEKQSLADNYGYAGSYVLENSVNITEEDESGEKKINTINPVFLFLGRIHESKGIEEIVDALKILRKERRFKFILCGNGPLREQIIDACKSFLGEDFEYAGVVSGDKKEKIIRKTDFFLLPSRYGEGLPMALLETMAAGVIPVVTDDASMKYIVEPGINGIRVKKNNAEDLYKKLWEALTDDALCSRLSLKAKETIAVNYNLEKYLNKLNSIYAGYN